MNLLLRFLRDRVTDHSSLLGLDYTKYREGFARAAELSGIHVLKPHPYSIRHGAASHDVLILKKPLATVQKKGRWRTFSSVTRYEKHARLIKELNGLGTDTINYARLLEPVLCRVLVGRSKAPPPPGAAAKRLRTGR